jgi:hypothetical protein
MQMVESQSSAQPAPQPQVSVSFNPQTTGFKAFADGSYQFFVLLFILIMFGLLILVPSLSPYFRYPALGLTMILFAVIVWVSAFPRQVIVKTDQTLNFIGFPSDRSTPEVLIEGMRSLRGSQTLRLPQPPEPDGIFDAAVAKTKPFQPEQKEKFLQEKKKLVDEVEKEIKEIDKAADKEAPSNP